MNDRKPMGDSASVSDQGLPDRELLERAARAAGMTISSFAPLYMCPHGANLALIVRNDKGGESVWNPLADDGDALRLAVKLRMDVETSRVHCGHVFADVWDDGVEEYRSTKESEGSDPLAATRRAIVRAAAALDGRDGE